MNPEIEIEMRILCDNIRKLRKRNRLSRRKMAKLLRISVFDLYRIEKGAFPVNVDVSILWEIRRHFGIDLKDQFRPI